MLDKRDARLRKIKKIILAGLSSALLLVSCGGGGSKTVTPTPTSPTPTNPTPTPAPTSPTLYQGVWGWAIGNPTTQVILDRGAVIYNDQASQAGRTVAGGVYINEAQTRKGLSILGPISGAGKLETGFTVDTSNTSKLYFVGVDDNGIMENYKGMPSFAGSGTLLDSNNNPTQSIVVVLVQTSTTVPTGVADLTKMKVAAKAQAMQALQARLPYNFPRVNPEMLKVITKSIQN